MHHINDLRSILTDHKIDAYIIPNSDPHKSEYIPDYWKTIKFISGFTGSAGTVIVTQKHAGLWTDSRYYIQAGKELTPSFTLYKDETSPSYIDWVCQNISKGGCIGINPELFSANEIQNITLKLKNEGIEIKFTNDLFSDIWKNRPSLPKQKVFEHPVKFAGKNRKEKICNIQEELSKQNANCWIATSLGDIAWALNLRGNDIIYNPVIISYLIITNNSCLWFVDKNKVPSEIIDTLANDNIYIKNYHSINECIQELSKKSKIATDKNITNQYVLSCIEPNKIKHINNIIENTKSVKNKTEIGNFKHAQIKDGNAMVQFLYWFYQNINKKELSELDLAKKIIEFRKCQEHFVCNSFAPISAYGENAALPHYNVTEESNTILKNTGMFLIDSGGQYFDGTTDITRTISTGSNSNEERNDFTRVLKGHIRIASTRFPEGTKGFQLDSLSRIDLWSTGKNFGHGTGHGIGYFLNVHEGPHGISHKSNGNQELKPGMLVTNEPGIYIEGEYGIRTENVLLCKKDEDYPGFLKFETLTLCPYDKSLINKKLLNSEEIKWLNEYHKNVYKVISPTLPQNIKEWLFNATKSL